MLKRQDVKDRYSWATLCLIGISLLAIAALTLFPYDFFIAETRADFSWAQLIESQPSYLSIKEVGANVALFIPLGFGLAQAVSSPPYLDSRRRTLGRALVPFLVTLGLSFAVTLSVESLQIFLPSRSAAYSDLIANTTGGGIGYGLWWQFSGIAERLGHWLADGLHWISTKSLGRQLAAVGLGVYCCVALSAAGSGDRLSLWSLNNWASYPLMLGNEASGDRPWTGRINSVQIYSQSLEPAATKALLAASSPPAEAQIASYRLSGPAPYTDQSGHLPALVWQEDSPDQLKASKNAADGTQSVASSVNRQAVTAQSSTQSNNQSGTQSGVLLSPQHWLKTETVPTTLTQQLKATEAFTLSLSFSTDNNTQAGPARIFSLSKDPFNRNLTIGQDGPHLNLRLRTPLTKANGHRPEFVIPNVFLQVPVSHRLVVTYDAANLAVYIDRFENSQAISLSPEATFFWQLSPPFGSTIHLSSRATWFYKWLYRALFAIPIGGFLALATPPRPSKLQLFIFVSMGILLPCLLLEIALTASFWMSYGLISIGAALLSWLILLRLIRPTAGNARTQSRQ